MKTKMEFEENKHLLNFHDMDKHHIEFVDIYNTIDKSSISSYKNVASKLFEQTKIHFCEEEKLMDKNNYPRKKEHLDEHNKVLMEMEYFIKKADSKIGQMMLKSYLDEKLPSWFDLHLMTMDSDLAYYLKNNS